MKWKLYYSPMLTYSEKASFKKYQWTRFSKSLICTEKSAQQAFYMKNGNGSKEQFSLKYAMNPYVYDSLLWKARKFICPGNYPQTLWNITTDRCWTNSLKHWIKQILNVWETASNLGIQWEYHFTRCIWNLTNWEPQCCIGSSRSRETQRCVWNSTSELTPMLYCKPLARPY